MRCIFCKQTSDNSRSTEHILPESLGNRSHTLPPGIVCGGCNNYFARKIEKPVLDTGHFRSLRFQQAIPNKKGNVPSQKAILRPNVIVELVREEDGSTVVRVPTEHWDSVASMGAGELMFPTDRPRPDDHLMSRFLAKVALEAMAFQLLAANHPLDPMIDESQLDPLRDWDPANIGFFISVSSTTPTTNTPMSLVSLFSVSTSSTSLALSRENFTFV
nr:HNH endonuclease [Nitrosomonas sp. JL21]